MQLRSNIIGFRQEDREPLALAWERMKHYKKSSDTQHPIFVKYGPFFVAYGPNPMIWVLLSKLRQAKSYDVFFGLSRLGALPPRKIGPFQKCFREPVDC